MRRRSKRWVLPGLIAAALGLAFAQQQAQEQKPQEQKAPPQDLPTLFHTETRVVVCNTTVIDKNGHLVTDLTRDAFQVFENNVQQQISEFRHEDVPVSLGLIIDNSGSMRTKRAAVEAAS